MRKSRRYLAAGTLAAALASLAVHAAQPSPQQASRTEAAAIAAASRAVPIGD